jgi:hypothetical protein
MMGFKWAGILAGALTAALLALANILLVSFTTYHVPGVVNDFGVGLAAASTAIAFSAHAYNQLATKLDLTVELLVRRLEDLENRVGDHNTGFVEGYLASHGREASVVPLATYRPGGGRIVQDIQAPYRR